MNFRLILGAFLLLCLLGATGNVSAQGRDPQNLGVLKPQATYVKHTIYVAPFRVESNVAQTIETIPRIIRRDLEISGYFKPPADLPNAGSQNLTDGKRGAVDFDAWKKMGVEFYVMGRALNDGGVRVLLYNIDSRSMIFSRVFTDAPNQERRLAHAISDEIVKYVTGAEGIASTKILYVTEQMPGTKEIAIMDADGFAPRQLTNHGSICTTPDWGARGTEFFYTSYHGNRGNLYGQQLSSGKAWTVAAYGGTNHSPAWSEAAGRLVLVLSKDGNSEIYTAGRDGSDLRRLTKTKATEGSPTWSPDGTKIAFTSNEEGGVHLFVMNADGSGKRRITQRGHWNDAVSWSPDGRRLCFVSRIGGVNDIFICDASGDNASYKRLTQNQGQNESPQWAPDGRHILFSSNRAGGWQVYIMLDDGSNQIVLSAGGKNSQPSMGPIPAKR